jgi:hypothetical protein
MSAAFLLVTASLSAWGNIRNCAPASAFCPCRASTLASNREGERRRGERGRERGRGRGAGGVREGEGVEGQEEGEGEGERERERERERKRGEGRGREGWREREVSSCLCTTRTRTTVRIIKGSQGDKSNKRVQTCDESLRTCPSSLDSSGFRFPATNDFTSSSTSFHRGLGEQAVMNGCASTLMTHTVSSITHTV